MAVGSGVSVSVRVGTGLGGSDVAVSVGGTEVAVPVGAGVGISATGSVGSPQAPRPRLRSNNRSNPPRNLVLIEHPHLQSQNQITVHSPEPAGTQTVSTSIIRARSPSDCMTSYHQFGHKPSSQDKKHQHQKNQS